MPKLAADPKRGKCYNERMPIRIQASLSSWRWRSPDGVALLFALAVFAYGASRTGSEYRWSDWAYGDAQILNAAEHFRAEGFIANHFLPAMNPGPPHSLIPNNAPNGRYTHYPALHALVAGLLAEAWPLSARPAKIAAVTAFALSLLLTYLSFRALFGPLTALLAVFFIGSSRLWLDFMDALCGQPYDELFRAATLMLSVRLYTRSSRGIVAALWTLLFLQACNSIEYFVSLQILVLSFLFLSPLPTRRKIGLAALFLSAPLLAFGLHFLQTAAEWQGVSGALRDWSVVLRQRVMQPSAKAPLLPLYRFFRLMLLPRCQLLFRGTPFFFILGLVFLFSENAAVLGILAVSSVAFYLIFPHQASNMSFYSPVHFLPLLALTLAGALAGLHARLARWASSPLSRRLLTVSLVASAIGLLPLDEMIPYLRAFPNPLWQNRKWAFPADRSEAEWKRQIARAKALRDATRAGDLVFVPQDAQATSAMEASPLEEFFSQRHLVPLGDNLSVFRERLAQVLRDPHRRTGRVLFLVDPQQASPPTRAFLEQNYRRLREVDCGNRSCSLFGLRELTGSPIDRKTIAETRAALRGW